MKKVQKLACLIAAIETLTQDHPEYQEENTTGWDLLQGLIHMKEDILLSCDFKGFGDHIQDCERAGLPLAYSDLVRIAEQYDVPVITREELLERPSKEDYEENSLCQPEER